MAGAQNQIQVDHVPRRGKRPPRCIGSVFNMQQQFLYPWMCHPMRPGETLLSASLQGEVWMNSMVNLVQAPIAYAQIGVYFVPVSAYGPGFQALFSSDAEDIAERGGVDITGVVTDPDLIVASQTAFTSGGYLQQNRPWAGEIAKSDATDIGATYVPWTSHGTYIIADNYFGLDTTLDFPRASGLLDNPPLVEPFVRSATRMAHALGTGGVDTDPSAETSLTQMLESLYVLTSPSRNFSEVLAGFGVNPRRASGMPVPVMLETVVLQGQEDASMISSGVDAVIDNAEDESTQGVGFGGANFGPVVTSDPNDGIVYSIRPVGSQKGVVSARRERNVTADTFGMLIGVACVYPQLASMSANGHHLDANRMLNLGHWGDPSFGGIDEIDLMTVQDLYNRPGTTETAQQAFNLMNLYLHGDEFQFNGDLSGNVFDGLGYFTPAGAAYTGVNTNFTSKMSCQLQIRTDLVS